MQYVTVLLIFGLTLTVSAPVKQGCYSADDVETEALFLLSSGSSSTNVSVSSCSVLCGLWDNLYAGEPNLLIIFVNSLRYTYNHRQFFSES